MKVIHSKQTQALLDQLSEMLDFATKRFENDYSGQECFRFQAFHNDPNRKQILNEMHRVVAVSIPIGYEYEGKVLAQEL